MAATCNIPTRIRPSAFSSVLSAIVAGLQTVGRALEHRRDALMLASLDDRMLADIGLTRSDLRDAYAEPLWRDPTDMLAGRACEKRKYRQTGLTAPRINAPSLTPDATLTPRARRTTRHPV